MTASSARAVRSRRSWLVASGIVASICALSRPALAFRTGADSPELKGTPRVRWDADTISFQLFKEVPSALALTDVQDEIVRGMQAWSKPACSAVHFDFQGISYAHAAPGDGVNTVEWVQSGWADRGFKQNAAGITDVQYGRLPGGNWVIVEADMYLNGTDHSWVLEGDGGTGYRDVLSVVTHEFGHMLGLFHPCEAQGADSAPDCASNQGFAATTMYPFYMPTQATLSADDQAGDCFLYPPDGCANVKCAPGTQCINGACAPRCGGLICGVDETCSNDTCVSSSSPCETADCDAGMPMCMSAFDCKAGFACVGGQCRSTTGEAGDPCARSGECLDGTCSADGYCIGQCAPATCDGGPCLDVAQSGPACPEKLPLGSDCHEANQCIGAECLAGAEKSAICTRACGGEHAACPSGWECKSVQGRSVCAPPDTRATASGGCALARPADSSRTTLVFCLLGLLSAFAGRRRAKRLGRPVTRTQLVRSLNGSQS